MLSSHHKFHVVNNLHASNDLDASSNANESFEINIKPWKLDSNGALSYGAEITRTLAADVAGGASNVVGAEIDNTSNLYLGYHCTAEMTSDDTAHDGTLDIYMESSTDAGTTYPSDKANFDVTQDARWVGAIKFTHDATGTDAKAANFEVG